jgi:hypothetical protein
MAGLSGSRAARAADRKRVVPALTLPRLGAVLYSPQLASPAGTPLRVRAAVSRHRSEGAGVCGHAVRSPPFLAHFDPMF